MNDTQPAPESPNPDTPRVRVAILFGGRSSEHAISCVTAGSVLRAIDRSRYDVVPVGITPAGQWVLVADDPAALEIHDRRLPEIAGAPGSVVVPLADSDAALRVLTPGKVPRVLGEVDVVLPLLHGPYGEDGTVQGLLELAQIPYVGSGVLASALGMDKHYMKIALAGHGLPVGPYVVISPAQWERDQAAALDAVAALGMPVFVKPARGGSSIGITRVERAEDLPAAVAQARRHDPKVIVEAAIAGREIECAVLGGRDGGPPRIAELGEIVLPEGAYYDFESKYLDTSAVGLVCPADIPEQTAQRVRTLAVRAFEALGCEALARVDVFVTPSGQVILNEVNTMPGFTPHSMYPLMWQRSGLGYAELVDELIALALERPVGLR